SRVPALMDIRRVAPRSQFGHLTKPGARCSTSRKARKPPDCIYAVRFFCVGNYHDLRNVSPASEARMSGYLENGHWHSGWYDTRVTQGEFVRTRSIFRNWITADGSSRYPAEPGRYRLYVSLACPWAHRTLIARSLKKLEEIVSVSVVEPVMSEQGW